MSAFACSVLRNQCPRWFAKGPKPGSSLISKRNMVVRESCDSDEWHDELCLGDPELVSVSERSIRGAHECAMSK